MTDYIAAYRAYLSEEKRASANTLSSYIRDLTQFQSWLITNGTADLRKVKKETINEYLLHMNHSGKSPATVTRSTASIKSFYSYMVQSGAVKTSHEGGAQISGDPDQPRGGAVLRTAQVRG